DRGAGGWRRPPRERRLARAVEPRRLSGAGGAARANLDASAGMPRIRRRQRANPAAEGAGQSEIGRAGITSRATRRPSDSMVGSAAVDSERRREDGTAAGQAAAGRREQARLRPRRKNER